MSNTTESVSPARHATGTSYKADVEAELIRLASTAIRLLNTRDFSHPWFQQHISPNVRVDVEGHLAFGIEGFVSKFQDETRLCEAFDVDLGNITAIFDEKRGQGTVILSQHLKNYRSNQRRRAGSLLLKWALSDSTWTCQSAIMILGTPVFIA